MKNFALPAGLANLVSSITNWDTLSHDLESTHDGWVQIKDKKINLVKEIDKLPNLRYCMKKVENKEHYSEQYYVVVTNEVGQLIELYMRSSEEQYAGLELNEFLSKTVKDV